MRHEEVARNTLMYCGADRGKSTPWQLLLPVINIWERLLDVRHELSHMSNALLELEADLGVRLLSVGNVGGGMYQGPYRSFQVHYEGETAVGLLRSFPTAVRRSLRWLRSRRNAGCITCFSQMWTEISVSLETRSLFLHDGRIAVSRKGSGRREELLRIVAHAYTEIVEGQRSSLELWSMTVCGTWTRRRWQKQQRNSLRTRCSATSTAIAGRARSADVPVRWRHQSAVSR